ncbi:hypothetical protein GGS21DRAFT_489357 [Xylaria nigripes]|nr:hypothetical protein GGS21DRAFT_489357 [Xylaria nigripes]
MKQIDSQDAIRTLTLFRSDSILIETLTLGNDVTSATGVPSTVVPDSESSNRSSSHIGAILSGVAGVVLFLLLIWACCDKSSNRSRRSQRLGRRNKPRSSTRESAPSSSEGFNGSSNDGSSVVSIGQEGLGGQPAQSMPGMPPTAAGRWPGPPPGHMGPSPGASMGTQAGVNMAGSAGRGGPPPTMGRGGQPFSFQGGPPPPAMPQADGGNSGPVPPAQ